MLTGFVMRTSNALWSRVSICLMNSVICSGSKGRWQTITSRREFNSDPNPGRGDLVLAGTISIWKYKGKFTFVFTFCVLPETTGNPTNRQISSTSEDSLWFFHCSRTWIDSRRLAASNWPNWIPKEVFPRLIASINCLTRLCERKTSRFSSANFKKFVKCSPSSMDAVRAIGSFWSTERCARSSKSWAVT